MKMKKVLALLLTMLMLVCALAACGSSGSTASSEAAPAESKEEAAPAESKEEAAPAESEAEAPAESEAEAPAENPHASPDGGMASMTEVFRLISEDNEVCFNGLRALEYKERGDVDKALGKITQKAAGEPLHVGFLQNRQTSVFFEVMKSTVENYCAERGWTVETQCCNGDQEVANQVIRSYITMQVDVIFANCNIPATAPIFTEAAEAGIPVVCTGNTLADWDFNVVVDFITSAFSAGWYTGVYTCEHEYKPGDTPIVGFVLNMLGSGDTDSRTTGFIAGYNYAKAKIDGVPYESQWDCIMDAYHIWKGIANNGKYSDTVNGIEYVGYGNGETPTVEGGQKAAQDLVVAHPEINLLFVETDNMYPGVRVILDQNGIVPGETMKIACAADATKFGMDYMKAGEIVCIGNNSSETYSLAAMRLIEDIFYNGYDANNLLENTFLPVALVTPENVDQFYDPNSDLAKGDISSMKLITVTEWNDSHVNVEGAPNPFED